MNKVFKIPVIAIAAATLFSGTAMAANNINLGEGLSGQTLMDAVNENEHLTMVKSSFEKTDAMSESLSNGENHYTLIVPSDEVLAKDKDLYVSLNQVPAGETVTRAFDSFVVPGRINLHDIELGSTIITNTVGGNKIEITRFGPGENDIVINNKNIESAKLTDNGYVYVLKGIPMETEKKTASSVAWFDQYINIGNN